MGEPEKLSIKYILNGDNGDIKEDLEDSEMVKCVVNTVTSSDNNTGEGSNVQDEGDDLRLHISFTEKIKAIRIVMRINKMNSDIELELKRS